MTKMKYIFRIVVCVIFYTTCMKVGAENNKLTKKTIDVALEKAVKQAEFMSGELKNLPGLFPRSADCNGKLTTSNAEWWTSGFYPGELWYLYEFSKSIKIQKLAKQYTEILESQKWATDNHDIGFMLYCSFGNGLRLTNDAQYKQILLTAASSLMKRFNPKVGLIRSWDFNKENWQYPVIIDNMMNLELLFWAAKQSNDSAMYKATVSHATKTMIHHFRPDYSCWHVVSYDTITGLPHLKQTHQGLNDSSSWARGQAWALYGFTMVYRETKDPKFLKQATNVAEYIINNPAMPADKIPLWDFNDKPTSYRDASAGALIASALIELAEYTPELKQKYLNFAKQQLIALSSSEYTAQTGQNAGFILKHSVGNYPKGYEIDAPLSYADYYYVEAMLRYRKLLKY